MRRIRLLAELLLPRASEVAVSALDRRYVIADVRGNESDDKTGEAGIDDSDDVVNDDECGWDAGMDGNTKVAAAGTVVIVAGARGKPPSRMRPVIG